MTLMKFSYFGIYCARVSVERAGAGITNVTLFLELFHYEVRGAKRYLLPADWGGRARAPRPELRLTKICCNVFINLIKRNYCSSGAPPPRD